MSLTSSCCCSLVAALAYVTLCNACTNLNNQHGSSIQVLQLQYLVCPSRLVTSSNGSSAESWVCTVNHSTTRHGHAPPSI